MPSLGVSDNEEVPVLLVRWFESRLHESVGFFQTGCRLYGLEVIDPEGLATGHPTAARVSFLAEAHDRESVVRHPHARIRCKSSQRHDGPRRWFHRLGQW